MKTFLNIAIFIFFSCSFLLDVPVVASNLDDEKVDHYLDLLKRDVVPPKKHLARHVINDKRFDPVVPGALSKDLERDIYQALTDKALNVISDRIYPEAFDLMGFEFDLIKYSKMILTREREVKEKIPKRRGRRNGDGKNQIIARKEFKEFAYAEMQLEVGHALVAAEGNRLLKLRIRKLQEEVNFAVGLDDLDLKRAAYLHLDAAVSSDWVMGYLGIGGTIGASSFLGFYEEAETLRNLNKRLPALEKQRNKLKKVLEDKVACSLKNNPKKEVKIFEPQDKDVCFEYSRKKQLHKCYEGLINSLYIAFRPATFPFDSGGDPYGYSGLLLRDLLSDKKPSRENSLRIEISRLLVSLRLMERMEERDLEKEKYLYKNQIIQGKEKQISNLMLAYLEVDDDIGRKEEAFVNFMDFLPSAYNPCKQKENVHRVAKLLRKLFHHRQAQPQNTLKPLHLNSNLIGFLGDDKEILFEIIELSDKDPKGSYDPCGLCTGYFWEVLGKYLGARDGDRAITFLEKHDLTSTFHGSLKDFKACAPNVSDENKDKFNHMVRCLEGRGFVRIEEKKFKAFMTEMQKNMEVRMNEDEPLPSYDEFAGKAKTYLTERLDENQRSGNYSAVREYLFLEYLTFSHIPLDLGGGDKESDPFQNLADVYQNPEKYHRHAGKKLGTEGVDLKNIKDFVRHISKWVEDEALNKLIAIDKGNNL